MQWYREQRRRTFVRALYALLYLEGRRYFLSWVKWEGAVRCSNDDGETRTASSPRSYFYLL